MAQALIGQFVMVDLSVPEGSSKLTIAKLHPTSSFDGRDHLKASHN